jgi:hypothetical protein
MTKIVMLSAILLSVVMLSVAILTAVILSVVMLCCNSGWSGFSSKWVFIEMGFHRMAFSSNAQFNLVFKTVSRISVALLHPKLLMIWREQHSNPSLTTHPSGVGGS